MGEKSTPWTPGPWVVESGTSYLPEAGGADIFATSEHYTVACTIEDVPELQEHGPANRRLIAAAPEMAELLAALVTARLDEDAADAVTVGMVFQRDAAALLARIRGEAS